MSRIPQPFIDDLMNRIDIVEVIDARVPLKKAGKEYRARCPFHTEKTPSFNVSAQKQFYHCFGCGANGNAVSFLMDYDHLSFPEAIATLASIAGVEVPQEEHSTKTSNQSTLYEILTKASEYYQQQLRQHKDKELAVNYLKQRGLSGNTAKAFGIGYAPPGWDNLKTELGNYQPDLLLAAGLQIKKNSQETYDRFRNRIMFPIRDRRGRVIAFGGRVISKEDEPKYLNSPETEVFHKRKELYGLYEVLQANRNLKRILVVEGYMDVVMLAQYGITYAVATLGTATTTEHLQQLTRHTSEIIFCFDGDRAGYDAAWKALNTTLPILEDGWQINFMFLDQGQDPDTTIQAEGKEAFEKRIENALPLHKFLFKHLSKEIDLNRPDGQAKLVALALPLISQIPGKILQHKLFDELATQAQVPLSQLPIAQTAVVKTVKAKTSFQQYPSLMQRAISILLQKPSLATKISSPDEWKNKDMVGAELFAELLEFIHQQPQINTGAIVEHWRERGEYTYLITLASRELITPEEGLAVEFEDVLSSLKRRCLEQQLNVMQRKAKQGELNENDRQQYLSLLTQRNYVI